jgi:hypothetical protein
MVLYRSPELFITDRQFIVRYNPRVRYAITELKNVHVVCEEIRHAGQAVARYVGAWAIVMLVVALMLDSPTVLAVALPTLGAAAAIGTLSTRRRTWELRARHRESDVCLFTSSDELRFGQVRRAVVRALEANEQP